MLAVVVLEGCKWSPCSKRVGLSWIGSSHAGMSLSYQNCNKDLGVSMSVIVGVVFHSFTLSLSSSRSVRDFRESVGVGVAARS